MFPSTHCKSGESHATRYIFEFNDLIKAVNRYPQWFQVGAVGPDYPYLHHLLTSNDVDEYREY